MRLLLTDNAPCCIPAALYTCCPAVFASYIAVISGLGITLMLLALYRKALPALPVSIALGVLFYFLTRLVVEPFVVPLSLNMAYY
jgi:presenilin 1